MIELLMLIVIGGFAEVAAVLLYAAYKTAKGEEIKK